MSTPDPDRDGLEGDVPGKPDQEPRTPLDVDTTFAAIVAHWADEDDDTITPSWPEQENLTKPAVADPPSQDDEKPTPADGPIIDGPVLEKQAESEPRVVRPAMPDAFDVTPSRAEAELEERFVPPEPPPLPKGDLFSRLAWAGVLGGPLFLLIAAMAWREAPQTLVLAAVGAFIGGFVALVVRLPQHHDDDDDDGAIV